LQGGGEQFHTSKAKLTQLISQATAANTQETTTTKTAAAATTTWHNK